MPVQAWAGLDISILLINLSQIAQMMLGPIQTCRKLLGVQSCLNMVLFRAIGYPFMPKPGSTAKYKVAKFKIWQGRIQKSPNAKKKCEIQNHDCICFLKCRRFCHQFFMAFARYGLLTSIQGFPQVPNCFRSRSNWLLCLVGSKLRPSRLKVCRGQEINKLRDLKFRRAEFQKKKGKN